MSGFKRAERVSIQVHRALADLLREVKDPRVVPLSITQVRVTDDLRLARVRVVPLGGVGSSDQLLEGLRAASGFLSRKLAKQVRMKYAPRLEFHLDESLEQAISIVEKLDQLQETTSESTEEEE